MTWLSDGADGGDGVCPTTTAAAAAAARTDAESIDNDITTSFVATSDIT